MGESKAIAVAIEEMLSLQGWTYLLADLKERLKYLDQEAGNSDDPNRALACYRERIGILYVVNRAKDLVEEGKY